MAELHKVDYQKVEFDRLLEDLAKRDKSLVDRNGAVILRKRLSAGGTYEGFSTEMENCPNFWHATPAQRHEMERKLADFQATAFKNDMSTSPKGEYAVRSISEACYAELPSNLAPIDPTAKGKRVR